MKDEFDAAVVSATKSFQTLLLLAVIFILIRALRDNYKILVLRWNKKGNEEVRPTCKTCATLAYPLVSEVEDRFMIMKMIHKMRN
jgi:hypothetical protein